MNNWYLNWVIMELRNSVCNRVLLSSRMSLNRSRKFISFISSVNRCGFLELQVNGFIHNNRLNLLLSINSSSRYFKTFNSATLFYLSIQNDRVVAKASWCGVLNIQLNIFSVVERLDNPLVVNFLSRYFNIVNSIIVLNLGFFNNRGKFFSNLRSLLNLNFFSNKSINRLNKSSISNCVSWHINTSFNNFIFEFSREVKWTSINLFILSLYKLRVSSF